MAPDPRVSAVAQGESHRSPGDSTEIDDVTLERAKRGDPSARERFVKLYETRVFALVGRLLVTCPAEVDDVAQEVFVRALGALGRVETRGESKISTWLLTIATRASIDVLRRTARSERRHGKAAHDTASFPDTEAFADMVTARDLDARIRRVLAELSHDHRAVLVLRAYHDLDYGEIAEVLGIDEGTVKSRLSRARTALKAELEREKVRNAGGKA
ncbi:MAG: RNA polymerase sigma factor [Myxococcota bacterium]